MKSEKENTYTKTKQNKTETTKIPTAFEKDSWPNGPIFFPQWDLKFCDSFIFSFPLHT